MTTRTLIPILDGGTKSASSTLDLIGSARARLRKELCAAVVLGMSLLFLSALVLMSCWPLRPAARWLVQSTLAFGYVIFLTNGSLDRNHRRNTTILFPTLGPGTCMTLFRGLMLAMLAGFLFQPRHLYLSGLIWVPGILYLLAAAADALDGYLARIFDRETLLGAYLDTRLDAMGLLVAAPVACGLGQLPLYYMIVGLAYYGFRAGVWIRRRMGLTIRPLGMGPYSRLIAGIQMGFVGVALLPLMAPPATTMAAVLFMIPLLGSFIRDWLVMSGRFTPSGGSWNLRFRNLFTEWSPVVLRLTLLFSAALGAKALGTAAQNLYPLGNLILSLLLGCLVLGILGRISAILVSLTAGMLIMDAGKFPELTVVFASAVFMIFTGTGVFSIWRPLDRFLLERLGKATEVKGDYGEPVSGLMKG